MKDQCFLVIDERGVRRMTKTMPGLSGGEFYVKLKLEIDSKFFDRVAPVAELKITDAHLTRPNVDVSVEEAPASG